MKKQSRYTSLDVLRGLLIISMVAYHAAWDLVYIFDVPWPWYGSLGAHVWQRSISWGFILLSGFCCHLGRKKLKRGLIVLASSVLISAVTAIALPESPIRFGVLSLLGTGMLLAIPAGKVLSRVNPYWGGAVCAVLFAFFNDISQGTLGFFGHSLIKLPESWYKNNFTAYLGLPHSGFYSSDYVPLLPWIFLFFTGYFIYEIVQTLKAQKLMSAVHFEPLEFLGRHSLIIYLAHQPVIYGLLYLIFEIL